MDTWFSMQFCTWVLAKELWDLVEAPYHQWNYPDMPGEHFAGRTALAEKIHWQWNDWNGVELWAVRSKSQLLQRSQHAFHVGERFAWACTSTNSCWHRCCRFLPASPFASALVWKHFRIGSSFPRPQLANLFIPQGYNLIIEKQNQAPQPDLMNQENCFNHFNFFLLCTVIKHFNCNYFCN